jgi:hypothetical protein
MRVEVQGRENIGAEEVPRWALNIGRLTESAEGYTTNSPGGSNKKIIGYSKAVSIQELL